MDESGLLMAPLVRRSWAHRGHPPVIEQKADHREKVSVAAALWLTPLRDRLGLAYRTLVNGYFNNVEVAEFLGCAVEGLPDPVIAIWDGGTMHKGGPIRELVDLLPQECCCLVVEPLVLLMLFVLDDRGPTVFLIEEGGSLISGMVPLVCSRGGIVETADHGLKGQAGRNHGLPIGKDIGDNGQWAVLSRLDWCWCNLGLMIRRVCCC